MRLFVAIDLDNRTKASLPALSVHGLKTVKPEQTHLTLAFLGDVAAPTSDEIIAAMREPIPGVGPFQMAFGGFGVFPPRGAPRVLWLGVSEGMREVIALQEAVAVRLQGL